MLDKLKVPGAILISLLLTGFYAIEMHQASFKLMAFPPSLSNTSLKLSFDKLNSFSAIHQVFSFLISALFDATGTLIDLLNTNKFSAIKNNDKKIERSLLADSLTTTSASLLSSSSTSPYIESGTGIKAGGRTGLTAAVVSLLFLVSLFFSPLMCLVPNCAVGAALVISLF